MEPNFECSNQTLFCRMKIHQCDFIGREHECPYHKVDCGGDNIPTFRQWLEIYQKLSEKRHEQTGMLDKSTRNHVMSKLRKFVETMNYSYDDKVSLITRKSIQEFCNKLTTIREISKKSAAQGLQQCFSRWIRFETEDQWNVPKFDIPEIKDDSDRFHEPDPEILLKIACWYRDLYNRGHGRRKNRDRLYSTLMLHYAMRNGDCDRIRWNNIHLIDGKPRLEYTPHKTRLSSKRVVKIWMNLLDYHDFMEFRKNQVKNGDNDLIFSNGSNSELKNRLNAEIKGLGVEGYKGLYLLRKICINSAYKEYGKEHAEAISGDDYKTIQFHYSESSSLDCFVPKCLCF